MSAAFWNAFLLTAGVTVLFELAGRVILGNGGSRKKHTPQPVKVAGLLAGIAGAAALGPRGDMGLSLDPPGGLWAVLIGGLLIYAISAKTDFRGPRSLRHFIATVAGAVVLYIGGFSFAHATIPGIGLVAFPEPITLALTIAWVFLVVGIVELCGQVPLLSSLIAIVIGSTVFLPLPIRETFPGQVLAGALIGVSLGRLAGEVLRGRSRTSERTENLVLGYVIATATLSMFLKSMTLTSLVLPATFIVLLVIILVLQSFERSIILRPSPRG